MTVPVKLRSSLGTSEWLLPFRFVYGAENAGFTPERPVIEVRGKCVACARA